jgi:hypothetical protein
MDRKDDKEFKEFISASGVEPPKKLTEAILARVREDLNPNGILVFSKLVGIHTLSAIVTLSICPQFGFRLFGEGMGLMHSFMALGTYGCMIACGGFFTGLSLLAAVMVLKPREIKVIRQNRLLALGGLTFLSLGFFIMVDAEILLSLAVAWFAGAFVTSLLTLELGWHLKQFSHS